MLLHTEADEHVKRLAAERVTFVDNVDMSGFAGRCSGKQADAVRIY
jgi:hypothetical protein